MDGLLAHCVCVQRSRTIGVRILHVDDAESGRPRAYKYKSNGKHRLCSQGLLKNAPPCDPLRKVDN